MVVLGEISPPPRPEILAFVIWGKIEKGKEKKMEEKKSERRRLRKHNEKIELKMVK
jgi:hypothetical protein